MTNKKLFIVDCIPSFMEEKSIAKFVLKAQRHGDRVIACDDS